MDDIEKKIYTIFIEGKEYQVNKPVLTGGEVMDIVNMVPAIGLYLREEDGTEVEVVEDDVIDISLGSRFMNPPRFRSALHGWF